MGVKSQPSNLTVNGSFLPLTVKKFQVSDLHTSNRKRLAQRFQWQKVGFHQGAGFHVCDFPQGFFAFIFSYLTY